MFIVSYKIIITKKCILAQKKSQKKWIRDCELVDEEENLD